MTFHLCIHTIPYKHILEIHAKRDGSANSQRVMKRLAVTEQRARNMHCKGKLSTQGGATQYKTAINQQLCTGKVLNYPL